MEIKAKCPKCGETDVSKFAKNSSKPNGLQGYCRTCQSDMNRTSKVRHQRVPQNWKYRYNLTEKRYYEFFEAQGGVCALCGRPERMTRRGKVIRLSIDHDHLCCPGNKSCGKCVRGLLCNRCNKHLGYWGEDISIFEKAVSYVTCRRAKNP